MNTLSLYVKFLAIAFRSRMQYRSDFLIGIMGVMILHITNLTLISVWIHGFQTLGGWNYWEIVLLYSMWLLSHSVYAIFFWHISTLEDELLQGHFDQYLLRPCSPLMQFLGREINYMGVGDILVALVVFSLAYLNLGLYWSLWQWFFFGIAVLAGLIIESTIAWIIATVAFWTGRTRSVYMFSVRFNLLAQQYPMDAFGTWYRVFITGFLPVAFVNYYPLTVLLHKSNALGWPVLGYLSPLVAFLLLILGKILWQQGLRQYTSSGN